MTFAGFKIIESEYLTEAGTPVEVVRSWRERLFSRPWRPFQRTRTVVPQVPSRQVFRINSNTLVMHPEMARKMRRELEF